MTKFLPMSIPYFRKVVVASFECPHCACRNNELMGVASIGDHGVRLELSAKEQKDLSRQLVVSEHCRVSLPEFDFEASPPQSGYLTTVEGLLARFIEGVEAIALSTDDRLSNEQKLTACSLLERLKVLTVGSTPFRLILDDPSGNSFVERLELDDDAAVAKLRYRRSAEQQEALGLQASQVEPESEANEELDPSLFVFTDSCPGCGQPCDTRMHPTDIPHFKEVIIMATVCDRCGYKSSEVKGGGAVSAFGRRITLRLESLEDLSRDVLKSETCQLTIPEIELQLGTGTLGGRFTTVEGLLDSIKDEMVERVPFAFGDSADVNRKRKFDALVSALESFIDGSQACTIILDDPLGNSYIQSLCAPDPDPQLLEDSYERTFEQNEEFGLNDIRTTDYTAEAEN